MSQTFNARDLIGSHRDDIISTLPEIFFIRFDDGSEMDTTKKHVIYSHIFWRVHREYPKTPLLPRHLVTLHLKGGTLNSNTHIDMLSVLAQDVCETYALHLPEQKEPILSLIYEITNEIYNDITKLAEPSVLSLDILDFIELQSHPKVVDILSTLEPNPMSIATTYRDVHKTIESSEELKDNPLVKAIKSKMVNANQINQCLVARGFPTEVTGAILSTPVMTNYVKGFRKLYDFAADSRSAAKALYFSEAPLQDAEYFARRLQILGMPVESIAYEDCGTTQYLNWLVRGPETDDRGNEIYPGDLKFMRGKYYLDKDGKNLLEIQGNEKELYGKVIKIRSILFCKHHDPHSVCSTCFGALSKNISRFANLGHLTNATMTQQTSQSVLSTKHLDSSSVSASIVLTDSAKKFFETNKERNAYLLKQSLKGKNVTITIDRDRVIGLIDLLDVDDIENLNPMRISSLDIVDIGYEDQGFIHQDPVVLKDGNRNAMFTLEFLKYIKEYRWLTDPRNNLVFNLKDWDINLPIFRMPNMEYSFSDHSKQIAAVIESSMKNIADRTRPESPVSTLQEVFQLVNSKLNVNIAALEVTIYANMTPGGDKFFLARNKEDARLNVSELIIMNRSLGGAYTYEDQANTIMSPRSFFKLDRPSTIQDVFIMPKEVVEERKRKNLR